MNADAFQECVQGFAALVEKKVSTFVLLEIAKVGHSYQELDQMISKKIRANDILGITKDGRLQILLSQATEKDLQFILPRFEDLEIAVSVVQ